MQRQEVNRTLGPETIFIEVRDRPSAQRVAAWCRTRDVGLVSPPDCAAMMGLPWWLSIVADLGLESVLDCGSSANLAALAMRAGIQGVVVDATPGQSRSLRALAALCRCTLMRGRPESTCIDPDHPPDHQQALVMRAFQNTP